MTNDLEEAVDELREEMESDGTVTDHERDGEGTEEPEYEVDGQPDEHQEWQDVHGGDEDPADYDRFEGADGFGVDGMGPDGE